MISGFLEDLKQAARLLLKSPAFAFAAIVTLGLGIAANTTVFGWVDTVLLHPISGVEDAASLAALESVNSQGRRQGGLQHPDFRDFQKGLTSAAGVIAAHASSFTIGPVESPQRVLGQVVSANFFAVLGVKPYLGRLFDSSEDVDSPGAHPIAVISHRLWSTYFHRDAGVIGGTVRLNGRQVTIVGVAAPDFAGSLGGVALDVWVPLDMIMQMGALNTWAANDRNARFLELTVRLKPGVTIQQAAQEAQSVAAQIAAAYPDTHRGVGAVLVPVWQASYGLQRTLRDPLRILMGSCILVLFIACANVANLLMARTITRQREFGIRLALGAGRQRLIRQLGAEMSLLAGAAAALGVLLSQWLGESLVYVLPSFESSVARAVQPLLHVKTSADVMVFTILIATLAVILSALLPVLAMSRMDVNDSLKEGGRSGSPSVRARRTRNALVAAEVALATVALIGAGLALRSFQELSAVSLGFDSRNVLVAQFQLSTNGYTLKQELQFSNELRRRLRENPAIKGAAHVDGVPLSITGPQGERVQVEGSLPDRGGVVGVSRQVVSPGYFDLMKIPLLAGRDFTDQDDAKTQRVIIVNETFARTYFGTLNVLGRTVRVSGVPSAIVGVARDSKYHNPPESPMPFFYGPMQQIFFRGHNNFLFIRAAGDMKTVAAILRRETAALDPNRGLFSTLTLDEHTQAGLFGERIAAALLSVLGCLSLILAAVGLYSVMAYAVSERTQEMGIRLALGADRAALLGMVLTHGFAIALAGVIGGIAVSYALAKLAASATGVPVRATDPLVVSGAAVLLMVISVVSTFLPAYRASRVEPLAALRSE